MEQNFNNNDTKIATAEFVRQSDEYMIKIDLQGKTILIL